MPPKPVDAFPRSWPGSANGAPLNAVQLAAISTTRMQRFDLDAETTQRLVRVCRARGTTVTGALGAAIMRATADQMNVGGGGGGGDNGSSGSGGDEDTDAHKHTIGLACGADVRKLYAPPMPPSVLAYHVSGVPTFVEAMSVRPAKGHDRSGGGAVVDALWPLAARFRTHLATTSAVRGG
jgi:hypothetical protein